MMSRYGSVVGVMGMVILGASLPGLQGQAPSQSIEQQLHSKYQMTQVGANGVVVRQPGSVLEVHEDGLLAVPALYAAPWYSTFLKKDGRIKPNVIQHIGSRYREAMGDRRPFQVGEKLYLTDMEVTSTEVVFHVQSCGACDLGVNPNDPPYRARLAFQFDKGYLSSPDAKPVLETIARVFVSVAPPPPRPATRTTNPAVSVVPLKLPSAYAKAETPTDQLQLNADNSFSLQEGGQTYRGTFAANGSTLELDISGGPKTTATIQGKNLTDSSGQTWVLREQAAPGAVAGSLLQNQDVVKMVKAGLDDALILAKIGSSKCQFDTSTDALIQLKQSGVSAVVIKAIMGAGK